MSDTTPANDDQADIQKPVDNPTPAAKRPVDKALAAAKAAKVEASDVFEFKDYDDKLVVVTRSGQKIAVPK